LTVNRIVQLSVLVVVAFLVLAAPAMAQGGTSISFSPSIGAGIIMLGAGLGIARIGAAAVESMARQPEASGDIRGGMILAAALIEGATFFALIVCILHVFNQ
jgi:F-type H+-transporting ATPase subunit c